METASRSKTVRIGSGTLNYIAPEFYHGKPTSRKSDVYGFGVLCHEVISGQKSYGGEVSTQFTIMRKKIDGEAPCQVQDKDCPPAALELVNLCCATDPEARPTMEEVNNRLLQLPDDWVFEERSAGKENEVQLREAAKNGLRDVVQSLLKRGVHVDAQDENGATPLYFAARFGDVEVAEVLIDANATLDSTTVGGATPLFVAAENGEVEVVRCLLQGGATVDWPNKDGATALYIAAQNKHVEVVEALIEAKADVNHACTMEDGSTALMVAAFTGSKQIVKLLKEKGASIDHSNKSGNTALMWAQQQRHDEVSTYLRRQGARSS
eukprot:evm.model.scf_861.2 EVM.evm.TU.scf_861.2   scf_861:22262-32899(-)